jgi:hypothetical protein
MFDAELFKAKASTNDIHNGVYGADFVKVNSFWGNAMNSSFNFGQSPENCLGTFFDARRQVGCFEDGNNFTNAAPVPVIMRLL